jgi:hypothetical protein
MKRRCFSNGFILVIKPNVEGRKMHEPFLWNNIRVSQEECAHG